MIWIDYAILGMIIVSAVIGFFRGFFREAVGLASWVLAFWLAFRFAAPAAALLASWISVHSVRLAVAFGLIFILALILGAVVNYMLARLVARTGFGGTDRMLGAAFGLLRGIAVLVILVLLAGLTAVPRDAWWQHSPLIGQLQSGAVWVRGWLPADLAGRIRFDKSIATSAPPSANPGS